VLRIRALPHTWALLEELLRAGAVERRHQAVAERSVARLFERRDPLVVLEPWLSERR
jgi:hypothetical protein